jgi:hypothetical protein
MHIYLRTSAPTVVYFIRTITQKFRLRKQQRSRLAVSNYRLVVIRGGSNHVSIANESASTSLRDDISLTALFKVKSIPEHSRTFAEAVT